jgi:hypothetical protein
LFWDALLRPLDKSPAVVNGGFSAALRANKNDDHVALRRDFSAERYFCTVFLKFS